MIMINNIARSLPASYDLPFAQNCIVKLGLTEYPYTGCLNSLYDCSLGEGNPILHYEHYTMTIK